MTPPLPPLPPQPAAEQWIEAVPNFSEGRDQRVLERLRDAAAHSGAAILDFSADADHNRCVLTLAGPPGAVAEAMFRAAQVAVAGIDLTRQRGVHPRIGALDVAPFVPLHEQSWEVCLRLANEFAQRLWRELGVPSYFYERAARQPARRRLENVRRGGFEGLAAAMTRPGGAPDAGDARPHPTAGATAVGVRKPLIAFNVFLDTQDVSVARRVARAVRESSGGMPHVKALGLFLERAGLAQVSVNLTDYEATPLHGVFDRIAGEAQRRGVAVAHSEIIGLLPEAAMDAAAAWALRLPGDARMLVIERLVRAARHGG